MAGDATQGLVTSATGNTVTYTISDATTTQKGVLETATSAEAIASTSNAVALTPLVLTSKLGIQTQFGIPSGNGTSGAVQWTSAMTNGMIPIGFTGTFPVAATITAGTGISITNGAGSITIDSNGYTWSEETGTTVAMAVQTAYIANNASLVTLTLPVTMALGESIRVVGKGAGLFKIAQNASQTIHFVNVDTTTGTGGSLTAIEQYAAIEIVCITANSDFAIIDSSGNFTVV